MTRHSILSDIIRVTPEQVRMIRGIQILAVIFFSRLGFSASQNYCQINHWPDGHHPHPTYCDRYVTCTNGLIAIVTCPPGSSYDARLNSCSYTTTEKCNDAVTNTTVPPGEDWCRIYDWATGKHPHPNTCALYVECFNHITVIRACNSTLSYDPAKQVCVYSTVADSCHYNKPNVNITVVPHCANQTKDDVLFLFDSSSSIAYTDYQIQLNFASNLTTKFSLGASLAQFSVVVFSIVAQSMFPFNRYYDHHDLEKAIMNTTYVGSTTNTAEALDFARTTSFSSANGARSGVPQMAVVLTDGLSNDQDLTKIAADKLKANSVEVLAIGVGNFSQTELNAIASGPQFVKQVDRHTSLPLLAEEVYILMCNAAQNHCDKADVIFLLDSSSSIGYANYVEQLRFAADITQNFRIGPDDVRFAALIYGSDVHRLFDLDSFFDHNSVYQAITSATYLSSSTNTAEALRLITDLSMFSTARGGRTGAKKIVITLTDGMSDDPVATRQRADELKQRGIRFMSIGVGNSVDIDELTVLSSSSDDMFCVESYQVIDKLKDEIVSSTCQQNQVQVGNNTITVGYTDPWGLCREQNWENGIHAFPFDCTKYIECVFLLTYVMTCPIGLVYDPLKKTCLEPFNAVDCKTYNDYKPVNNYRSVIGKRNVVNAASCSYLMGGSLQTPFPYITTTSGYNAYTTSTTLSAEFTVCSSAADVLLILDSSGSIGSYDYAILSNFSAELSKGFRIGPDKIQFSAILIESSARNVFNFNTYNNNADVAQALLKIPYISGGTNTADSLNYARTTSFSTAHGARPNVGKVAVVITDGNSNDPLLTAQAAAALQQSGVTTIAVGVGSSISQSELLAIASSPSNVFNVTDFSVLDAIKKGLVQTACHSTVANNICATYQLLNGNYPDPSNCQGYVECSNGVTIHGNCPNGMAFNVASNGCMEVHSVNCNDNANYHFIV
ncbi:von Willebrand factor-like isoform X1 [Biomphalaria glabrata]|uniref:von Willebrand factor-like isoform X1 n=1 Tax=Biomphalaria glabrata TaxID=6526 RepID=A0A9W2ZXH5_BIOGL|nr:von Willebrand factor-like isoform X1 [Biomphalaria glabrata]XP_055879650.1 von Willebrand factor-like isoform X1 [Biomphalaria glabrata]KAI8735330.1 collagen alpha-1(XII) chain-like [Biomphalaria glabrata]